MKGPNNLTREAKLSNCTFVKTVLMLLVVLYHCMVFWTGRWFVGAPAQTSVLFSELANWLDSFHIYCFTFVSGYIFYYLKYEKKTYRHFPSFFLNKVKRLLVPYVFISAVWVIPISQMFYHYGPEEVAKKFLWGTGPSQLWFLLMLFFVFCIFFPLSDFFRKHFILGMFGVVAFYCVSIIATTMLPNVFQIWTACGYIPFFWLGFQMSCHNNGIIFKIPGIVWIAGDILLFVAVRFFSELDGMVFTLIYIAMNFVLHLFGTVAAFVILQKISARVPWKSSKIFTLLSKSSMSVFLVHQQLIYFFIFYLNDVLAPWILMPICFVGTMIISISISYLLMRFKLTRFAIGEK